VTALSKFDDFRIMMAPVGWRYTLVLISEAKAWLAEPCDDDFRSYTLNMFDKWCDGWLAPEMIAIVDPMPQEGREIFKEASKLPWRPAWPEPGALDLLAREDVFRSLCVINPSILAAIKWRDDRSGWREDVIRKEIEKEKAA
jgi:hypothetical protein